MSATAQAVDAGVERSQVAIEAELQRILNSEFFSGSKRSQDFLRHIVEVALSGRTDDLKERILGVELFGRAPAYDTGEDSIVRGKARDVRRRLAQYNLQRRADQIVRIEVPVGSYVPEFHWLAEIAAEQPPKRRSRVRTAAIAAGLVLVIAMSALFGLHRPPDDPLRAFWKPVIDQPSPVMVCIGHPVVYLLSKRVHEQFRLKRAQEVALQSSHSDEPTLGQNTVSPPDQYQVPFSPKDIVGGDIIPVPDQFLGVGDAHASFQLASTLRAMQKATFLRVGNDVSFSELRSSPLILVGAFSNRWTLKMTSDLRFAFEYDGVQGKKVVADHKTPGRIWSPSSMTQVGKVPEDYAIVSRLLNSKSGQMIISAAGITQYGSQAAGEFLTNSALIQQALKDAPQNWERMNMQFVLKTKVIGLAPGPPEVIAKHFW